VQVGLSCAVLVAERELSVKRVIHNERLHYPCTHNTDKQHTAKQGGIQVPMDLYTQDRRSLLRSAGFWTGGTGGRIIEFPPTRGYTLPPHWKPPLKRPPVQFSAKSAKNLSYI